MFEGFCKFVNALKVFGSLWKSLEALGCFGSGCVWRLLDALKVFKLLLGVCRIWSLLEVLFFFFGFLEFCCVLCFALFPVFGL